MINALIIRLPSKPSTESTKIKVATYIICIKQSNRNSCNSVDTFVQNLFLFFDFNYFFKKRIFRQFLGLACHQQYYQKVVMESS